MEFIKPGVNINFVGRRYIAFAVSGLLILATIVSLIVKGGPNYGIDFAGGIMIQVKFEKATNAGAIKKAISGLNLGEPMVQRFGQQSNDEFLIRVERIENADLNKLRKDIEGALASQYGKNAVNVRRVELVGPKVGKDLRQKALFAIFYAILFIVIYISGRFELKWMMSIITAASLMFMVYIVSVLGMSVMVLIIAALLVTLGICWFLKLKYALGAILALIHDVTITVGAFSLTDKEITLPIVAALLTIVGYSLNDTIIVFDRIRENLRKARRKDMAETMNSSINQTLSRTILTSGTTLIVVIVLFLMGGGVIHDFAFALLVGIFVGTYSSIYVASPILLVWQERFDSGPKRKKGR
jgi:preprotein translocase subunit SecF